MCSSDLFLGLLAIIFPPLAVWVKRGICSADSLINICLCMLGFLPGLIHAWYIIAKYPESDDSEYQYERVAEEGRGNTTTTYYIVQQDGTRIERGRKANTNTQGYGATANMPRQTGGQESGTTAGPSSGEGVPPSYADAVKGDHKVQSDS